MGSREGGVMQDAKRDMTPRERVLTALRRKVPDRVPKHIRPSPALTDSLREAIGTRDIDGHFGLEIRFVALDGLGEPPDVRPYLGALPEGAVVGPWGTVSARGSFYHFSRQIAPMRDFTDCSELDDYPFPAFSPDLDVMRSRVAEIQSSGLAAVSSYINGPYEQACGLRGQAEFLADLASKERFAHALLDRITALKCQMARAQAEAGVDVVWIGDDLGMQDRLVFSPETWRAFIRPCLERITSAIREASPDVLIAYHSCGHVEPVVGELADAGVQVLESVQPEANDVARLKQEHGDRLSFWGTVGDQSVLPYGTPDEVREQVRTRMETVGKGGGLMIAPAHVVEPEVPVENVMAFFEAVEEYGGY